MTVYLAEASRAAGIKISSTNTGMPASNLSHIHLSLVSSNWGTAGAGTVEWGVEYTMNAGLTWKLLGGGIATIGLFNKSVLLPSIGLSRLGSIPNTAFWHVYVRPSINMNLGVSGDFDAWVSPG